MRLGSQSKLFNLIRLSIIACLAAILAACLSSINDKKSNDQVASRDTAPCNKDDSQAAQGMPDTDRIFSWIEDLVNIGYRRTGTPAGYASAAYVKCEFEKLGLQNVQYELATSWKWEAKKSELKVGKEKIDSFPSAYSFVTPDEPSVFSTGRDGMSAELISVGQGSGIDFARTDVKGKIVVFDLKFILPPVGLAPFMEFFWDPGLTVVEPSLLVGNPYITNFSSVVEEAMKAGAVGFVGVLVDYFDSNKYYNEYLRRTQVTIPGVWVTKNEGARLREMMKRESSLANLKFEGSRTLVEARSVVGFLHGKSKDTIMVQSHHDSAFDGAVEDGSGVAAVFALAQFYASKDAASREKTLMFSTFDTHFSGYQSHMEFVRKYITDKETPYNIVANVTLEHIAKQGVVGDDGKLVINDQPELRAILNNMGLPVKLTMIDAIVKHDLRRTFLLSAHALCTLGGIPTDASFVCAAGVPTASLIAGPNYLYDEADTLDKVAKDELVPVTKAFIDIINAIDKTPASLIGIPLPSLHAL
ncbi:MAG: M28 family peptidase [Moraxellaceae bacterium]|nr:M28 family peptidase [Moraxellaceae bacterium]MDZ4387719.1 M28 family peptidase [Moraxellaceae bacterium]